MARRDELRRLLEERRERLQETVREQLSYCRERPDHRRADGADEVEVSSSEAQEEIDISLIAIQTETIARIDEALARLTSGTYGRCLSCGDPISHARLRALPFAVRCLSCEEVLEARRQHEPAVPARPTMAFDEIVETERRLR